MKKRQKWSTAPSSPGNGPPLAPQPPSRPGRVPEEKLVKIRELAERFQRAMNAARVCELELNTEVTNALYGTGAAPGWSIDLVTGEVMPPAPEAPRR